MEVRGRNGKWLGTQNGRTVGVSWVDIVCKFCPRIRSWWRGMDAFVIINIVERCAEIGHHKHVGGEDRGRSGRGSINGKEQADGRKLAADFCFLDIEEASDVLDHLLVGERQFIAGRTVRRRGGYDVGSVASTVGRRGRMQWDEDGGGQARHCWTVVWYMESEKLVCMVDAKGAVDWRGFCKVLKSQSEVGMRIV